MGWNLSSSSVTALDGGVGGGEALIAAGVAEWKISVWKQMEDPSTGMIQ